MVTPSVLGADLDATSCCCSSTQRSMSGLPGLGPLRLRVWGVLWGVLGLLGLWGLWVRLRDWCTAVMAASLEDLSPCFVSLCPSSVPVLKLCSKGGLANDWPLLRAKWTASCLSWFRFTPQAPHSPCSLSLSRGSLVKRLWTRRLSWRNADRSLESCKVTRQKYQKWFHFYCCEQKRADQIRASREEATITKQICFVWYLIYMIDHWTNGTESWKATGSKS